MAGSVLWEVQKAVFAILDGDGTLTAIGPIYDHVPTNTDPPYVVVGDGTEVDWPRFGTAGREATITVHSWSRAKGMKELISIIDRIATLMDGTVLSLTGWTALRADAQFSTVIREGDGTVRHGVQRFRIFASAD